MVKAEITIEIKEDNSLHLVIDLLKREDWKEDEFLLAQIIEKIIVDITKKIKGKDEKIRSM